MQDESSTRLANRGLLAINGRATKNEATLVVIGVARGGTSLVAGVLNELGVFMGDESHPPVYEDLRLSRALEAKDQRRTDEVIAEYNRHHARWGWKRPGAIDYLEQAHGLLRNPRYLIVFKDLFSIANRNRISMAGDVLPGMRHALAEYHKVIDFLERRKPPALLVSYDKAVRDKTAFIDAIIDFSGLAPDSRAREKALSFVTPDPQAYMEATRADRVIGHLDVVSPSEVAGWAALAVSRTKHPTPLNVELWVNNEHALSAKADAFRTDLKDSGVHPSGKAAYRFELAADCQLQPGDQVQVFAGATRTELKNSPKTLAASASTSDDSTENRQLRPLVFLHIPKTAGTSLRSLLRRQLADDGLVTLDPPLPPDHRTTITRQLPQMQALLGHLYFGIDEQLGFRASYATFLRDPVARVVSFWKHQQTHPHSGFHAQANAGLSLREFVASAQTVQTDNHMTRILIGTREQGLLDGSNNCIRDERYLQIALENVAQRFCFIGFMEHFDESVRALFEIMNWPMASRPCKKLNALNSESAALDDATLQIIRQHNALDLALYQRLAEASPWLNQSRSLGDTAAS